MARIFANILIVMSVIFSCKLSAQDSPCSFTLSGRIIDEHDQSALQYASIFVKELHRGVTADDQGFYILEELCSGTYTLQISHVGCNPREQQLTVNQTMEANFQLEHHLHELSEVTVKGEIQENQTQTHLSLLEVDQSRGKSLGESLRSLNGVNTLQSGPTISKPVIQGLHSNRILILNNGVRQEGQQWGREHAPEIDPFSSQSFRVIKGATAIRYGADAIGGIVLVEPKKLMTYKGMQGNVSLVGQSNNRQGAVSAVLEGGMDNGLGWRVQGSLKKGGDAKAANYNLTNTGVEESNFSTSLGWDNEQRGLQAYFSHFSSDIAILRSAHIGNLTDLKNAINSDTPLFVEDFSYTIDNPKQAVRHNLLRLNGRQKVSNKGEITFQYGFQSNSRKEFDRLRNNSSNRPAISLNIVTQTLDVVFDRQASGFWKGEFGVTGLFQRNSNQADAIANFLIPDFKNTSLGAFVIEKYGKENWELELGLRYDFRRLNPLIFNASRELITPDYTFGNLAASLGTQIEFSEKWKITANLSTAWRPPHVSELMSNGLHHGAAAIEQGLLFPKGEMINDLHNVEITSEKATKLFAGVEYNRSNLRLEGGFYINSIDNYIYLRPDGVRLSIRGAFPVFQYAQTNARFVGFDGTINYSFFDRWLYKGQASFLRARDVSNDDVLINIPANNFRNSLTYTIDNSGGKCQLYFSLEAYTVLNQSNAPVAFLDFDTTDPPTTIYDFKEAPHGYTLINFHSGLELDRFKLGLSVENIMNTSYRDYMNRFRYFADDIGINYSLRLFYNF